MKRYLIFAVFALLSALVLSCSEDLHTPEGYYTPRNYDKVVILYAAGNNNLASALHKNIQDLAYNSSQIIDYKKEALLVFSHHGNKPMNLLQIKNINGLTITDTVARWPAENISASAEMLNTVLSHIREKWPSKEYDLIFSSHATGYLPTGYYLNYIPFEKKFYLQQQKLGQQGQEKYGQQEALPYRAPEKVPFTEPETIAGRPMVKSIGADQRGFYTHEINLDEFAEALPMKFHSIIFDCCLMGSIETAYELKDKCDYLVFSPTEIISTGMDYKSMGKRLFSRPTDLLGLCHDYYSMYDAMSGLYRSATISLVDCSRLEEVATICRKLIDNYRVPLDTTSCYKTDIQRYYTQNLNWFYDMADIFRAVGSSPDEISRLTRAIERAVIYKAATPYFFEVEIRSFSGLSMYLPAHKTGFLIELGNGEDNNEEQKNRAAGKKEQGSRAVEKKDTLIETNGYLENYYRRLEWNKVTGLVK